MSGHAAIDQLRALIRESDALRDALRDLLAAVDYEQGRAIIKGFGTQPGTNEPPTVTAAFAALAAAEGRTP